MKHCIFMSSAQDEFVASRKTSPKPANAGQRHWDWAWMPRLWRNETARRSPMGDTNNMRQLGSCRESGCGIPQNLSKARDWRAKALGII